MVNSTGVALTNDRGTTRLKFRLQSHFPAAFAPAGATQNRPITRRAKAIPLDDTKRHIKPNPLSIRSGHRGLLT